MHDTVNSSDTIPVLCKHNFVYRGFDYVAQLPGRDVIEKYSTRLSVFKAMNPVLVFLVSQIETDRRFGDAVRLATSFHAVRTARGLIPIPSTESGARQSPTSRRTKEHRWR
jgi:hypothetical protein